MVSSAVQCRVKTMLQIKSQLRVVGKIDSSSLGAKEVHIVRRQRDVPCLGWLAANRCSRYLNCDKRQKYTCKSSMQP